MKTIETHFMHNTSIVYYLLTHVIKRRTDFVEWIIHDRKINSRQNMHYDRLDLCFYEKCKRFCRTFLSKSTKWHFGRHTPLYKK